VAEAVCERAGLAHAQAEDQIVRDGEHPLFKAVKVKIVTNDKDKDDKRRD
jgi:hypothetical protein